MRAKIVAPWVVFVIAVLTSFNSCAFQEDLVALNNQVTALEQQNKEAETDKASLRSEVARYQENQLKSDQASRARHAELHALLNALREEMRQFRGELERGAHDAQKRLADQVQQEARLTSVEKSLQSCLDRNARIEQYLGMEPSEKIISSDADQDETVTVKEELKVHETPDGLYARAKQLFDKGEYENARELFRSLLKEYPKSKKAGNAQFWLGEIYYREKWYEKAILEYQKVIENYPKGNKTPGALLKQGFAFLNLDDKANTRLILKELIRKFPDSNEANVAKNKLKTLE